MNIYQPYVYIIRWSDLDRGYIGVRYAKGCHPNDLMNTYFTSSNTVRQMIREHGIPDKVKFFLYPNKETALLMERKFQIRFNVIRSDYWLNKGISGKTVISNWEGKSHSVATKQKLSEIAKGRKVSLSTKQKMSTTHKERMKKPEEREKCKSMSGKTHSVETKRKISISHIGKNISEETKQKMSVSQSNRFQSPKDFPRYDHTVYCFVNTITGERFTGTRNEIVSEYNLNRNCIRKIVTESGKSHKGWTLKLSRIHIL